MSDQFYFLDEPLLTFNSGQVAEDPKDGLALFGPSEHKHSLSDNVVIGTPKGVQLWGNWCESLNSPSACIDIRRHRPWPPYPGYDVAFGVKWPDPVKKYEIDSKILEESARKADKHERAFSVANLYLDSIEQIQKLDSKPGLIVCVIPDAVYDYCRPLSYVQDKSDQPKTKEQKKYLKERIHDHKSGQSRMFEDEDLSNSSDDLRQYGFSSDFRRQLKARTMPYEFPIQIIRESTLQITKQVRDGEPGVNPLSDRLWNFSIAVFYKCGLKPWKTPWAREGVCYIGLAYKQAEHDKKTACCAAQMFLDSGDGIVFVGDFGPWYSQEKKEFHLTKEKAEKLLKGTIETYKKQDGRPLKEIFLHSRSGIDNEEYEGFVKACPPDVKLVAIRVRKDRSSPRLFRYDNHPKVSRRGMYPVLRGTFWQRTIRHGLLFTTGFKPRVGAYDGWEIPVPLSITIQHGDANLVQVATDILGLTKLNYNSCQLGESQPITVKYSDRIGEILLANPEVPSKYWRHNFKYYI
jgi:hypothetical protein